MGIVLVTTFTIPPIDPLAYSNEAGPRITSICSTFVKSTSLTWSSPIPDTSLVTRPSDRIFTRSPDIPRITGCPTAAPKSLDDTPGYDSKVLPIFSVALTDRLSFSINSTTLLDSENVSPRIEEVITTSSIIRESE